MKLLFALLGVALVAASSHFTVGNLLSKGEYRYRYEAVLSSGIPVSPTDGSHTRLRAEVTVQIPDDRTAVLQLKSVQLSSETAVESGDRLQKRLISEEHQRLLELPIRFHYRSGMVSELQFASEEQPWSANIKRAVANMLQIDINAKREQEDSDNTYFTTNEKTIEGECEVAYSFVSEAGSTVVTKTINFEKCGRRGEQTYNERFFGKCKDCKEQKTLQPQTVYNYKIQKEQLKEIEVSSVYTVLFKEQPTMKTETRARLTLLETSEIRRHIEAPRGEKEELLYSNKWERSVEEFYMKGDEAEMKPFENVESKIEMIAETVDKIAEHQQNEPETVHMMARLVEILRMCTEQELHKVHEKVYKGSEKKVQSIIEHALAVAGTKNTIQHLIRHVELISVAKTVQLLKSIQETPFPSEQIAELLHAFAKTEICRKEFVLRQAVWLAYGSVVRGVIVPTEERTLTHLPKHMKNKYVTIMKKQWEDAETIYEKILALKTFANAGIDSSIVELEKIIYDKQQPTIVRMEAIDSLRLLSEQMPRKIVKVLMPIYMNRLEKNEIRMIALAQLMLSMPAQPEISQIVMRMERDPNQHVAAFTYHMLKSAAQSSVPAYKELSLMVAPLLRTSLYVPEQRILSRFDHISTFDKDTSFGMGINFGAMFGKDSAIPKTVMASLETVFGGNWNRDLAQIGFTHQNVEQLFSKILSKLNKMEKKTVLRASRISSSVSMLKELARKLNIRVRESTSEEPALVFYMRYKQMDYAILPVDEQMVDELIEKYLHKGSIDMKKIESIFSKDSDFDTTIAGFFVESIKKMSTSLGLPLTISGKVPTVLSGKGLFSLEKISYGVRARLQAQPSIASTQVHSMNLWSPIFDQGVKIVRSARISIPIDIEMDLTMKEEFEMVVRNKMPEEMKTLVHVEARPIAFIRFSGKNADKWIEPEEKTISLPKVEKIVEEREHKFEMSGLEFTLSGNYYRVWNMENVFFGEQKFQLTVRPTSRMPKEIITRLKISGIQEGRIDGPKTEKMLKKEMITEEGEWESRTDGLRREHLHKMVRDMELSSGYKHRVLLTVEGIEKSEMELVTECEGKLTFCRLSTEIRLPSVERRNWKLTSFVEVLLPRPVSSIQELKEQKHREAQIYTQIKWGSEEKNVIEIIAQLEQTKEQRNLVKEPKILRGLPAYELLTRLARLNQLKAVAKYELSPKTEKMFERLFSVVKVYTLWNSNLELSKNEPRQVFIQFTVDPIVPRMSQLTIESPKETLRVQNMRLPVYLPSIVRMPKNVLRHSVVEKSECSIKNNKVNTFDSDLFRAPLSTCYTVLAKDCTEEPRYAVLMKNVNKNGAEKMLKVIYEDNVYEMQMVDDELKVLLNGKKIREEKLEENKIEKIGELYVLDLGEVVVRFDGYTAKVLLDNTEMTTQCGLCGHFDGEKMNEYRTASNEETSDLEEFHRSYIVKTEECSAEKLEKNNYREYAEEYENTQETSSYEEEEMEKSELKKNYKQKYYDDDETRVPEDRVIALERGHKVCFSLDLVPQCPKRSEADRVVEQKVSFGCLPRHTREARRLLKSVRHFEKVELKELKRIEFSFEETMALPKTCIVA